MATGYGVRVQREGKEKGKDGGNEDGTQRD